METVLGIILLVFAVFLIAAILLQSSKSHKLPGTIAGGAETFFGKTKGSKLDRLLGIATAVVAIIFCVLVIIMYVVQDTPMTDYYNAAYDAVDTGSAETTVAADDTAAEADTTVAEETTVSEETTVAEDTAAETAVEETAAEETATEETATEETAAEETVAETEDETAADSEAVSE